ncbi:Trp biosynthesis-associated membrane protein [Microbacterium aureliae]
MIRRARLLAVVGILAPAALGVVSATQVWVTATLADGAAEPLQVAGADAVPLLTPLSLAALALGAALSIAGRILRYAFGVLCVLLAAALGALTVPVVAAPPVSSVASSVTEATGITGLAAVAELVVSLVATPWPAIALAAWLVLLSAGVLVLLTAHRWSASDRRYRSAAEAGSGAREARMPAAGETARRRVDAIDSWDDLSRGDDPTA